MEIFAANKQWSTRPEDERYTSIEDMHAAAVGYRNAARERDSVPVATLSVQPVNGDVQLVGRGGLPVRISNWAFGQLAQRVSAPAAYLRTLPAELAAQNINHGLRAKVAGAADATLSLLFHVGNAGSALMLRALTTDRYERVWNSEITERLLSLKVDGWDVARPDIRAQDDRVPLYVSDHDMFAFIRHSGYTVAEQGNGNGLQRGFIVSNSEVGASKLRLMRFLYREMCGNHIIWGAENVSEIALRHVGNIRGRLGAWDTEIRQYLNSSASDDEAMISRAQRKTIAGTKDEVLDALFGKRSAAGLSRRALEAGYDAVVPDEDGSPNSVWGFVQGLTRHSQTLPYADDRTAIDKAAGKLLTAF